MWFGTVFLLRTERADMSRPNVSLLPSNRSNSGCIHTENLHKSMLLIPSRTASRLDIQSCYSSYTFLLLCPPMHCCVLISLKPFQLTSALLDTDANTHSASTAVGCLLLLLIPTSLTEGRTE